MAEKIKILALALMLAAGLMLASFAAGWCMRGENNRQQPPPVPDTTWFTLTDTVTLVGPRDSLTRIVWKPYPVHDTTFVIRHTTDSVFVMLPYEHRHLHRPDTLDVWYSGVDARIDSATVYYHHTTEIVHHLPDVRKMPRLTAGVGCGAIYQEKRVNAYLFGEMRYNAPKTTFGTFAAIDPTGQWCAGASVSYRFDLSR
jgi:hypothetical protein